MLGSLKSLLASIVDYAGLFPPAKLGLKEAMANYAQAQITPYCWILGRFVLPASRLDEFEALLPTFPLKQWSLSVILSRDWQSEIKKVRSRRDPLCGALNNPKISITALEFSPLSPTEIEKVLPFLPTGVDAFFEIPFNTDLEEYLAVMRNTRVSAKIRTGGITSAAFPSTIQLCQCIFAFANSQVPFKATAGLHHPLPANYPLTYDLDSPSTVMQGFLNVTILAALVYWQKVTLAEAVKILKESSVDGFQFSETGISWPAASSGSLRDRSLTLAQIEESRQHFFRSFGSCSFQEPIEELKQLNLL